jgi:hypothetical protein
VTSSLQVFFGGDGALRPAEPEFYDLLETLEVEENADLPGAVELTLSIATDDTGGSEDLTVVSDDRFQPFARVAVVVQVEGAKDACIFDGYVLSHTIHLGIGITASTAKVWGQDVSCLMNLVDKAQARSGTDSTIAEDIFREYQFTPADENKEDPGPKQELMQRGTDSQFLRERARRAGRLFRVCCDQRPGENKGYFVKPKLDREVSLTFALHPVDTANVDALDFTCDVTRPNEVMANALIRSKDAVDGGAQASGLRLLDQRSLAAFAGPKRVSRARLTATVDDAAELQRRSEALLRDAGWFVRCEGEADLDSLERVPRVGMIMQVDGAGQLHSGKYFVWSVRHTITADAHRVRFVLVRNAVGGP